MTVSLCTIIRPGAIAKKKMYRDSCPLLQSDEKAFASTWKNKDDFCFLLCE
jgi:hypothetical protein